VTGINALKRFLELREMRLWYANEKGVPFFFLGIFRSRFPEGAGFDGTQACLLL
jgi:hypothetical protein